MEGEQARLFELLYLSLPGPPGTDLTPPCLMNSDLHLSMTGWHHPGTHKFRSWELINRNSHLSFCKILLGSQARSLSLQGLALSSFFLNEAHPELNKRNGRGMILWEFSTPVPSKCLKGPLFSTSIPLPDEALVATYLSLEPLHENGH